MHPYLTTAALLLPLLPILWLYTAQISRTPTFQKLRNKRICLLIAHPDDEAMFFAPTLLALTDPAMGNHIKILCLSTGNADSLGPLRKSELLSSALILGLRSTSDVFVLDSPDFPDTMAGLWETGKIASVLASAFAPSFSSSSPISTSASTSQPPEATIDVLITFDQYGVSGHANHRSLYHGAVAFLRALMRNHAGWACPVTMYTLTSTALVRKYVSVLDAPVTMLLAVLGSMRSSRSAPSREKEGRDGREGREGARNGAGRLLFVSGPTEYLRAQKAMVRAHRSQMRWFRWGWVAVGRFMVVNDLRRERVV